MADPAKLVLIDGHALIYRAYFALPPDMATARGELTNAVYGFTSMLLSVLKEEQPDYLAVTLDRGRTFRHDEYPAYKANRARMPDGLSAQFDRLGQLFDAFRLPTYSADGFEADDVLAALADQAARQGLDVLIVTGDTDTFQLVGPRVRVLTSRRQFGDTVTYDEAAIRDRYGLSPAQLIDYKALIGDKSDNVPGVTGIGDKTATALLQKYGSLEAIYAHLDDVTPERFRKALAAGRDIAFLSRRLVTIRTDVPVRLDLDAARVREPDHDQVLALFRALEFKSLLPRLPWLHEPPAAPVGPGPVAATPVGAGPVGAGPVGAGLRPARSEPTQLSLFGDQPGALSLDGAPPAGAAAAMPPGYTCITSLAVLRDHLAALAAAGRDGCLVVDVETTGLDPMAAGLVGISLAARDGEAIYIPVGHQTGDTPNLDLPEVLDALRPLLGDAEIPIAAHNANFDLAVLARHGLDVAPPAFDTMIAAWLLEPDSRHLGLKEMAKDRLHVTMTPIDALIGSGKKQITMDRVPVELAAPYACADADLTHRLIPGLRADLEARAQWPLFSEIEMPLVPVIVDMQRAGVLLDLPFLVIMSRDLGDRMAALHTDIERLAGHPLNINSTQQLSVTLFDELKLALPWMRRGKSGHYSTAADVLDKLKGKHPIVDLILEHRQLAKLTGTYVDALPALVNSRTGRVHTSYNQTGTVTGRLSSSNPNLQNIPIRTDLGREIRRAFIPAPGCLLLAADYSQIELRIMAHVSGDPAMLAAFARGQDIHAATAAAIYHVPLAEVTSAQRRVAKMTNFAISYGVTGYGLSERTGLTPDEADALIQSYFATYPQVKAYLDRVKYQARTDGYVETLFGRRRYFPDLAVDSGAPATVREQANRMAINAPIQGTAADILKLAMIRLWHQLRDRRLGARMILQVHDELVLEVPAAEMDQVAPLVVDTMEGALALDAPLVVDARLGPNWLEMEPYRRHS